MARFALALAAVAALLPAAAALEVAPAPSAAGAAPSQPGAVKPEDGAAPAGAGTAGSTGGTPAPGVERAPGTLPPANPPVPMPSSTAKPKPPEKPLPRAAVLEEIAGTVRQIDRTAHKIEIETPVGPVTLTMDRNTLVYTPAGLGTVLDLSPGLHVRAGRNADLLAYWIGVRASPRSAKAPSTPGQGAGPGGGSGAPPEGGAPTPGPGSTVGPGSVSPGPGGPPR